MNRIMVSFYGRFYYTNLSRWQGKVGCVQLWFLVLSWVSWDQRCGAARQFMTNWIHLWGLHFTESHCHPQYSELYSASFKITNWRDNMSITILCSHTMLMNGSPLKTNILPLTGRLFGLQQCPDDNGNASDIESWNKPSRDTEFRQPTNQSHPPLGYRYLSRLPPIPGAPQFYHPSPVSMTPSSKPCSAAKQWNPTNGPLWQWYDLHQGGYCGPQMFPPEQFTEAGP